MKILNLYPKFIDPFWSFKYALRFRSKKAEVSIGYVLSGHAIPGPSPLLMPLHILFYDYEKLTDW